VIDQRFAPLLGPVAQGFFVGVGAPELDQRAVLKNPPAVVADRAAGGGGGLLEQFFLREAEGPGGFEQNQNRPGRCGRDQFFGDLVGEGRQKIVVVDEKRQVHVIRHRVQRDHFDGEKPPV